MLIPMLDEIIGGAAAEAGRAPSPSAWPTAGRLNVLAHVLGKPYGRSWPSSGAVAARAGISADDGSGEGFSGDVKYHLGARRREDGREVAMAVTLAPNPSHLEFVNPVVEGMARAARRAPRPAGPPGAGRDARRWRS